MEMDPDERLGGETDPKSGRVPARKDRDRILYSTEFRRLAGVTQVASATENLLIHNRITHSIKVEQVGTAIVVECDDKQKNAAARLGAHAEWRVAAAGLGHDLGHPPFGHVGEAALHEKLLCREHLTAPPRRSPYAAVEDPAEARGAPHACKKCHLEDGFEGNAQSFRIVTKLAVRAAAGSGTGKPSKAEFRAGLDLTKGTLMALTKYPWLRGDSPGTPGKWGAYDCDAYEFARAFGAEEGSEANFLREATEAGVERTIEAEIMDWADDITYAVHDIDDFYRLGLVPLGSLATDEIERSAFLRYVAEALREREFSKELAGRTDLDRLARNLFGDFPDAAFENTPVPVATINGVVSGLINDFVTSTAILDGRLQRPAEVRYRNAVLKQLTWYYVIDNPTLATIQDGQRKVLHFLYDHFRDAAMERYVDKPERQLQKLERRLPPQLQDYITRAMKDPGCLRAYGAHEKIVTRGVVDFIASLSDRGAYKLYARLTGDSAVSILDPTIAV